MHRLINISLPDETIELIDQVIGKGDSLEETLGDRSRFINEAVQYYISQKALVNFREQLKEGAIQRQYGSVSDILPWRSP